MLSKYQADLVWKGLLDAETRSYYFADLSNRLLRTQKWLTVGSLLLSSGAGVTMMLSLTSRLPESHAWVRALPAFLAAGLSLWSLVAKNERSSIDSADLHFRWTMVALDYESVWQDVTGEDAIDRLHELQRREAELSKASTALPYEKDLMEKYQTLVEEQRRNFGGSAPIDTKAAILT